MSTRKRDKVAIVGWASSSRDLTPFADESIEIWGCNELGAVFPHAGQRWDVWFNLHDREVIEKVGQERMAFLKNQTVPVYMKEEHEDVPAAVAFPFDEIREWAGRDYFTSSIAWMVAFAVMQEYKEIHIYGVDMALESEYGYQRPCCDYWLGRAEGLGIKVFDPASSRLLKGVWLYGLEDPPEDEGFITERFCVERMQAMTQQITQIDGEINKLQSEFNGRMSQLQMRKASLDGARHQAKFFQDQILMRKRDSGMPIVCDGPEIVGPGSPAIQHAVEPNSDGQTEPVTAPEPVTADVS